MKTLLHYTNDIVICQRFSLLSKTLEIMIMVNNIEAKNV